MLLAVAAGLFVLSLAFAFGLPALQSLQRTARARATLTDLKQFEQAFQRHAHDHGDWPNGSLAPGAIPAGMEAALAATHWAESTPIGGRYIWFTNVVEAGERPRAAIAIVSTASTPLTDDRRQLEALLREGSAAGLDANELRLGFRNEPVYVLEQ